MKKFLAPLLFIAVAIALVMILGAFFPKYAGMLATLFIFLVADGYLWYSVRGHIRKSGRAARIAATALYWLPVALLISIMVYGSFVAFLDWNLPLRTYILSLVLVLFLAKVFPVVALLIADITRGIIVLQNLVSGKQPGPGTQIRRNHAVLVTGWILGFLLLILLVSGTLFWQFDFRVNRQEIRLNDLPPSFDGLKIVQISDIHLGSWASKEKLLEAMNTINGLKPDVIFFTGDMFNYCTADGEGFQDILRVLHAPFGIYAIMGNHDYGDYIKWPSDAAKLKNLGDLHLFYHSLGWKLLLNAHDILKRGSDSIAVIGVENWGSSHRFQRFGDVAKAIRGTETMAIQLLLSHDPSHWDSIVSKNYRNIDVTFSGHTHGGQVGINCFGIHWSPISWAYREWCGLYANPKSSPPQYLYVNQGLGNIGYSGRIGILPEITLITLKRAIQK
ncbi:MAG: metallophosphoesterase [Bacteroidota bacterium]